MGLLSDMVRQMHLKHSKTEALHLLEISTFLFLSMISSCIFLSAKTLSGLEPLLPKYDILNKINVFMKDYL